MQKEEGENQQQTDAGKEEKKFLTNIRTLRGLLKKDADVLLAVNPKMPKDDIAALIDEVVKESKEQTIAQVKKALFDVLEKYRENVKAFAAKEAELKALKANRMKEFNKEVNGLFNRMNGVQEQVNAYYASLKSIGEEPQDIEEKP